MPYQIVKSGDGWRVITSTTRRAHSKKSLSKAKATAQLRALYANTKGE